MSDLSAMVLQRVDFEEESKEEPRQKVEEEASPPTPEADKTKVGLISFSFMSSAAVFKVFRPARDE